MKNTIRAFYLHAGNTFMTKVDKRDKETFYMHALRHYTIKHTQDTCSYLFNIPSDPGLYVHSTIGREHRNEYHQHSTTNTSRT